METTPKFLRNPTTGVSFPWTEELAKRGDLIPVESEAPADADAELGTADAPRWLQNVITGAKFPATLVLLEHPDLKPCLPPGSEDDVPIERGSRAGTVPEPMTEDELERAKLAALAQEATRAIVEATPPAEPPAAPIQRPRRARAERTPAPAPAPVEAPVEPPPVDAGSFDLAADVAAALSGTPE